MANFPMNRFFLWQLAGVNGEYNCYTQKLAWWFTTQPWWFATCQPHNA